MDKQIIDLQERILYLEDAVQQLSDQVALQDEQLQRYELWFKKLSQQLRSMPSGDAGDQKPPHY